jgi:AbrB family looped-hinge helix DNA binding protein
MLTTIVTTKGQVVIPSRLRRKMNIKKGTKLSIEEKENEIVLKPLTAEFFERIAGVLHTKGKLSKLLLDERQKSKQKEE